MSTFKFALRSITGLGLASAGMSFLFAQSITSSMPSTGAPSVDFIQWNSLPAPVIGFIGAFGNRLQKPGNERILLTGTYTDRTGSAAAQEIWQVPGQIQFSRANQSGKPLVFSSSLGLLAGSSISQADADVLESLLDDSAESFFYGFQHGTGYRLLGMNFRSDDGSTPNYLGPWYSVYAASGQVKAQPITTSRVKHYYFDAQTHLLVKTRYLSSGQTVTTEFNKWTKNAGQSFPGQIVRRVNDAIVFTFDISGAAIGPAQNDGAFSGQ